MTSNGRLASQEIATIIIIIIITPPDGVGYYTNYQIGTKIHGSES